MSDLLKNFQSAVNLELVDSRDVVTTDMVSLETGNGGSVQIEDTAGSVSVQEAIKKELSEVNQNKVEISMEEKDGEKLISFGIVDTDLPYYFKSYDELAEIVIGNIFFAENIKSICSSHFGRLLEGTNPKGFTKVTFDSYDFFVQDNCNRIMYVYEFIVSAKNDLETKHRYECNLVKEIEINHEVAYTLVLTPKEMMDIQKSYPSYKISYMSGEKITDLKLIIQI